MIRLLNPEPGRIAIFALAILALAGRGSAATASDSLAENYAKWKAHRPQSFAFTYLRGEHLCHSCGTPIWRVEENGDSVVRVTPLSAIPADPGGGLQSYSLDTIFARIKTQIDAGHYRVEVLYNALLGFPEKVTFNHPPDVEFGTFIWSISDFTDNRVSVRTPSRHAGVSVQAGPARDLTGRAVPRLGAARLFAVPK
jgi:hypothetical protein